MDWRLRVFIWLKRAIRVELPAGEDQNQLLEVVGTGAILGPSETMSRENYRVSTEAEELTTASCIALENFVEFLDGNPKFCRAVVQLLSENLRGLYHKFRSASAHSGRLRVIQWSVELMGAEIFYVPRSGRSPKSQS